jgi:hypothetical protein
MKPVGEYFQQVEPPSYKNKSTLDVYYYSDDLDSFKLDHMHAFTLALLDQKIPTNKTKEYKFSDAKKYI